jgi:hypothetical protein
MTETQGNIHPLTSMALGRCPADAVAARAMVVMWLTVASGCSSNSAKPLPGSGGAVATTRCTLSIARTIQDAYHVAKAV